MRKKRKVAAPVLTFSLDEELAQLRKEPEWLAGDRNSVTLAKTPDLGIVLVSLRKGAAICGHEVDGPITVTTLEGAIAFRAGRKKRILRRGDMLALGKAIPHDVEAVKESAFVLTIVRQAA